MDIRTKYKKSGWGWSPLRHWKRRMLRDLKKMEVA